MDKKMLVNIGKYGVLIGTIIMGFLGVYSQVIKNGEHNKVTQFDDAAQKQEVIQYVADAPSPLQVQRKFLLDSINTASAINSRALRDSITIMRNTRDSLTAVTIYQIKERLEKIENH